MKVCLINPPQVLSRFSGTPVIFQPLGLAYIAACIEKEHSVVIIDAASEGPLFIKKNRDWYHLGLTFDEIENRIRDIRPEVIGITVPFTVNLASAIEVATKAKLVDKKIVTILGGVHPTIRPLEVLAFDCVDFVVMGEGENVIQKLLKVLVSQSESKLKNIPGLGFKYNNKIVLNSSEDPIEDVDSLPFPARHLLPMEKYFAAVNADVVQRKNNIFNARWTTVITSRGCPYNCNFCSIHRVMGYKFRPRTPENVIAEIQDVIYKYGIKHINFEDDNLTLDKKRAERIFDLIISNKIDITWSCPNGIRADAIDENLVRKMKLSGCGRVFVAPESGVRRVLTDIIGKNLDLEKVEDAIRLFRKYKIIVDGSFVIGFIGETRKEIWETINYAVRLEKMGLCGGTIHCATPYYGTRLYEEAEAKGFLREDIDNNMFTTFQPLIKTPDWGYNDVKRLRMMGNILIKINCRLTKKISYLVSICKIIYFWFLKTITKRMR